MAHSKEALLVWLFCVASLYCGVSGRIKKSATNSNTVAAGQKDQANWKLLSTYMINSTQRTGNGKLSVFSKILLVNMQARSKVGRSGDGVYLFQGDIKIDPKDVSKITATGNKGRRKRALMRDRTSLWKSPIHYQLSPSLDGDAKKAIASAIKEWRIVLPCVKWRKGTSTRGYLYFFPGDGCYSTVGRSRNTKQEISIGDGCDDHGTVVHEIAHALGFWHEQSRPDRDKYVTIHWNNIIPKMKFNFEKYSATKVNSYNKAYDYESVMHYGPTDFAKKDGLTTMTSKKRGVTFGDKPTLSKLDREQAQLLYQCSKAQVYWCEILQGRVSVGFDIPQGKRKKTPQTPPPPPPKPTTSSPSSIGSGSGAGASG